MNEEGLSISSKINTNSDFTPLSLCQRCQRWGQINIHNMTYGNIIKQRSDTSTTIREYVDVEQLIQHPNCAMCTSILHVYYMRSQVIPHLQSWPARHIVISITGPFYLDRGVSPGGRIIRRRPNLSDPNYIVVRTFLKLEVKALPYENSEDGKEESYFIRCDGQADVPSDEVRNAPTQFTTTPQFMMKYSNETVPVLCDMKEWEVCFFDIQLLGNWLNHCSEVHGKQCVNSKGENDVLPTGFRVIDTHHMKILQPNDFVRYVALSYMWSGEPGNDTQLERSNVDAFEMQDSLRALRIPDIIADAVALCRDLGERFLWVDRLCIVQDDQVNKPGQINAMDRIYHLATFTIIAALNTRNGIGLPGFANRPRHPRSSVWAHPHTGDVEAQGLDITNHISNVVDTSLWNKRGWTFQERLLSKRRLFITEYQVIYECCEGQAIELFTWDNSAVYGASGDLGSQTRSSSSSFDEDEDTTNLRHIDQVSGFCMENQYVSNSYAVKETASIRDYCVWVQDYSSRQLSFGTDILNAFAGVGNALGAILGSRLLHGLPEKYFTQCLLWSTSSVASPRGETCSIPSWSWASWVSAVRYDWHYDDRDELFLKIASLVYFYYQDPDSQELRKLDIKEMWIRNEISIEELSKREELPALAGKHIPGEWRTNRDWKDCPQNPWQTFDRQDLDQDACKIAAMFPGSLVFNTTVAFLSIDHLRYADGMSAKYEMSDASLRNKYGEAVGIMRTLENSWIEARRSTNGNKKLFDFIVLSGKLQKSSVRNSYSFFDRWGEMWLLDVMLVHRLPCKPFVARRVAVGTVTLCKWKDCDPKWETVVLC
ncbi:HET-domain-containing protein [Annulohypoxylon truncatum]|uniref:HET-domain-containing protein n=1 Tax=Annulohypoxylon truncatum TaxID=327061 RepID=UPI002008C78E|nr:HET-domain-containing protein [Annulohypoxylon truncatum]KAI1204558.1 HET-domain-containing protein [Annulohypoxylon truncatum]